MSQRILRSFSNTISVNTTSPGYISIEPVLENYSGHTNSSSISCGNISLNSSTLDLGWDGAGNGILLTPSNIIVGFHITVNSSLITVDTTRIANSFIWVGNTSVNTFINSTAIFSGNSTQSISITPLSISTAAVNVGSLPSNPPEGARAFVTDSTLDANGTNYGANVSGGGGFSTPVWFHNTVWRIG